MAVIPGSFKLRPSGKSLISTAGTRLLTPQVPAEEDLSCCCLEVSQSCELCEEPGAVCKTGTTEATGIYGIQYEMGVTNQAGFDLIDFTGGNAYALYDGSLCAWSEPDPQVYTASFQNGFLEVASNSCTFGPFNYQLQGVTPGGNPCGCNDLGLPWSVILRCIEITGGAPQEVLDCIGGPGLAWYLFMGCTNFKIGPEDGCIDPVFISWDMHAFRPLTVGTPGNCYNILGPYCPAPSIGSASITFDPTTVSVNIP